MVDIDLLHKKQVSAGVIAMLTIPVAYKCCVYFCARFCQMNFF